MLTLLRVTGLIKMFLSKIVNISVISESDLFS